MKIYIFTLAFLLCYNIYNAVRFVKCASQVERVVHNVLNVLVMLAVIMLLVKTALASNEDIKKFNKISILITFICIIIFLMSMIMHTNILCYPDTVYIKMENDAETTDDDKYTEYDTKKEKNITTTPLVITILLNIATLTYLIWSYYF